MKSGLLNSNSNSPTFLTASCVLVSFINVSNHKVRKSFNLRIGFEGKKVGQLYTSIAYSEIFQLYRKHLFALLSLQTPHLSLSLSLPPFCYVYTRTHIQLHIHIYTYLCSVCVYIEEKKRKMHKHFFWLDNFRITHRHYDTTPRHFNNFLYIHNTITTHKKTNLHTMITLLHMQTSPSV